MTPHASPDHDALRRFDQAATLLNEGTSTSFEAGISALTTLGAEHHPPGSLTPRCDGSAAQFCMNLLCDFLRNATTPPEQPVVDLTQAEPTSTRRTSHSPHPYARRHPAPGPSSVPHTNIEERPAVARRDSTTSRSAEPATHARNYRQMALDAAFSIIQNGFSLRNRLSAAVIDKPPLMIDLSSANLADLTLPQSASRCTRRHVKLVLRNADCTGMDLRGLTLRYVDFHGALLRCARMDEIVLHHCSLDRADASGATLHAATFIKCQARRARFTQVNMPRCTFQESIFNYSSFRGADLDVTHFRAAAFGACDLTEASLKRCKIISSDFCDAFLRGAALTATEVEDSRFRRADMRQAELHSCCFLHTCLCDAVLNEVFWLPRWETAAARNDHHQAHLLPGIPTEKRCTTSLRAIVGDSDMTKTALTTALATSQLAKDLPHDQHDHFVAALLQLHHLDRTPSLNAPICSIASPCLRGVQAVHRTFHTTHHAALLDCTDVTYTKIPTPSKWPLTKQS